MEEQTRYKTKTLAEIVHDKLEQQDMSIYDDVKNPKHYQLPNGGESVDVIRMMLTHEEYEGWCKGNLLKYIARYKQKGGTESLRKARVYLDWLIELSDKQ